MRIIHMIEDYKKLCSSSNKTETFPAYKEYVEKHKNFFDGVCKYLYCCSIDNLRDYIESADFVALLHTAEENYEQGNCDYIIATVKEYTEKMHVDFEFELLLGMELANIGGCSLPREDGVPYLYIGVDRSLTKEYIDIFVPHEMQHMLHNKMTNTSISETLFSRIAEEGVASYAPMWMHDMDWNIDNVARVLGLSFKQTENLFTNTKQLIAKAIEYKDRQITPELMQEYFCVVDEKSEIALPGYYIGLYLTYYTVKNGFDFNKFVTLQNQDIVDMWVKTYKK